MENPLEPRLFVYRRDGSALELLRSKDAEKWLQYTSALRERGPRDARAQGAPETPASEDTILTQEQCHWDPDSAEAREARAVMVVESSA